MDLSDREQHRAEQHAAGRRANNANYWIGVYTNPTDYLTPVGAFSASPGPYGTFDMSGDVIQWNETDVNGNRGARGGCWGGSLSADMQSSYRGDSAWANVSPYIGFRVRQAPRLRARRRQRRRQGGHQRPDDRPVRFWPDRRAWSQGCMDGDPTGKVDINDLTIVLANFGTTYSTGMAAVPEPGMWAFLAVGLPGLIGYVMIRRAGNAPGRRKARGRSAKVHGVTWLGSSTTAVAAAYGVNDYGWAVGACKSNTGSGNNHENSLFAENREFILVLSHIATRRPAN